MGLVNYIKMLHTETVLPHTYDLLKRLMQDEKLKDFNLVGGTALSLQIGHRMSVDLDMFSSSSFFPADLKIHLTENYGDFDIRRESSHMLITLISGVKVDFINYPYPLIKELVNEDGIRMYSLDDISAMKLSAIGNSGKRLKDFIDLAVLSSHFSLKEMLENFEKKFPISNSMHIIRSVGFHKEIIHDEIKIINHKYDWERAQSRIFDMIDNPEKIFKQMPFKDLSMP
jgi:hypothetical protein